MYLFHPSHPSVRKPILSNKYWPDNVVLLVKGLFQAEDETIKYIRAWHHAVSLESADTTLLRYTQCNSHQIQAWTSVPYKITTSIHHCCTVLQCTSLTFIHKEWEVSIDRLESYLRSFLPLRSFHHHEWFCTGCFCCVLITYYDFFELLIYKIMMCMQITSE